MSKKLEQFKSDFEHLVLNKLFSAFDSNIKSELKEFEELEKVISKTYQSSKRDWNDLITCKHELLKYTEDIGNTYEPESFSSLADNFLSAFYEQLEQLPVSISLGQSPERFKIVKDDPLFIKIVKPFKWLIWILSQLPRRIIGRKKTYWKHKVSLRSIIRHCLINQFAQHFKPFTESYNKVIMKAYIDLYQWETKQKTPGKIDFDFDRTESLKKELSSLKRLYKKELKLQLASALEDMNETIERAGTIELSNRKYSLKRIEKKFKEFDDVWLETDQGWVNTFDLFLESWRSDLALHALVFQANKDLELFHENQKDLLSKYIGEELDAINNFIGESLKQIQQTDDDLSSVLKKQIYHSQKTLDKELIPSLLQKLSNNKLINGVARIEANTINHIEKLTTERRTPKVPTDYLAPISEDEITTISPYDLIVFETAPSFSEKCDAIKAELVGKLNENLLIAQDLDHMIIYGFTTALEELDNSQDIEEAKSIAIASLNRSAARLDDIKKALKQEMQFANEKVSNTIEEYTDSLEDLTKTENVREIRIRIMRAKALQSTEEYKAQMKERVLQRYNQLRSYTKSKFDILIHWKDKLTRSLSIDTEEDVDIEVSNFLIDTDKVIESLPLIYRNLYQITPITDQELYVGRSKELALLEQAYSYWVSDKQASIAIIGEKWSGLTSFVNFVEEKGVFKYRCNRFAATSNSKKALFQFFAKTIDESINDETSWGEVAEKINSGVKKVIIIEDLQRMYFRKIGGFEMIIELSRLIQNTSRKVLWVVTCNLYCWQYFQKTIQLEDVFRFEIKMNEPTETEIEDIIQKRNRISGYKLFFKPSESDLDSKRFNKLSESEKQNHLKKAFFQNLIDFSSSNISMALMFWLLSTEEVTNDSIVIGQFKKPDFNFITTLPDDKISTLHLLILHDGLTIEQHASLARVQIHHSQILLSSMHEDGILLKKNDYFMVNPLIYRSVISLLNSKNLL
ncbi:hypothetical protein [Ekhidna sp.]|uniref:hypothetical protein n=1 Tax=Ekhidna sp. TaxID=2608089 RepID=UPI003B500C7F